MKKYWKSISISVIIVLSIGAFYVNTALSAEQYPAFVIETQSGDSTEIKPLVLEGFYIDNYSRTNVKITSEGSTFNSNTFLNLIIGQPDERIKKLQEEYRGFMRGKIGSINRYFEDKQQLVYAEVDYKRDSGRMSDFTYDISLLNKEGGDSNDFTVKVPNNGELDYVNVDDVRLIENELYLLTRNSIRKNDNYYYENHMYTIDIANQTITNHELLIEYSDGQGNQGDTYNNVEVVGTSRTTANEHVILLKTGAEIKQEITVYNLATKEKEKIDVAELNLENNQLSYTNDSMLYFTKLDGQEVVITSYNLVDDQIGNELTLQLSDENGNVPTPMITVHNGKLYAATPHINGNLDGSVVVADVNSGETLFHGQLALENSSQEMRSYDLFIDEIIFR
ncbi:hypothetical protein [Radiobacillus sp. PE A8.2]|uniref:hypothetical protein n=1 Tax=Radiobacillus sp. PE A8.2 TaxID=3380349 RepID=UPI00388E385A